MSVKTCFRHDGKIDTNFISVRSWKCLGVLGGRQLDKSPVTGQLSIANIMAMALARS